MLLCNRIVWHIKEENSYSQYSVGQSYDFIKGEPCAELKPPTKNSETGPRVA